MTKDEQAEKLRKKFEEVTGLKAQLSKNRHGQYTLKALTPLEDIELGGLWFRLDKDEFDYLTTYGAFSPTSYETLELLRLTKRLMGEILETA